MSTDVVRQLRRGPRRCTSVPLLSDHVEVHVSNPRSSQFFEAPVFLPLTDAQERVVLQLDFLKRWYLLCHGLYILTLVLVGAILFLIIEGDHVSRIDAMFIAMSTLCNCGLQTVDVATWRPAATAVRHVLMVFGGVVFTSAYPPLLRLAMLYRVRSVFGPHLADTYEQQRLRRAKWRYAQRLTHTSVICLVTSLLYFAIVQMIVFLLLSLLATSPLTKLDLFYLTLSAFHGCLFSSMEPYKGDAAVVGLTLIACALGFTAYPVVLRSFFYVEWYLLRLSGHLLRCYRGMLRHMHLLMTRSTDVQAPLLPPAASGQDEPTPRQTGQWAARGAVLLAAERGGEFATVEAMPAEDDEEAGHEWMTLGVWDRGFKDILSSSQPGTFHAFLFTRSESVYLGVAWIALTLVQALPLWLQQRNSTLAEFTVGYKVYLSFCQAGVVRFAAATFLPLTEYSTAHVVLTILLIFLPALPISTDRTYRKWKEMFRTSVVRLLTSRLFWLFMALVSILFAEEDKLSSRLQNTRFDLMTRTFFEVISAYAGCGLSLSLPKSPVSFIGSCGGFSRLVIAAVLLGGRHRFVDLGIDLGFAELQTNLRRVGDDEAQHTA